MVEGDTSYVSTCDATVSQFLPADRELHLVLSSKQLVCVYQSLRKGTMKVLLSLALLAQHSVVAFTASRLTSSTTALYNIQKGGSSADLGLPCVDECALESFPNLPPSVHPGVLSGQAQIDLLKHAKENGTFL
jgi:hypothetical protein